MRRLLLLAIFPLLSTCVTTGYEPVCGNGVVDPGEECDCGTGASPPAGCATYNGDFYGAPCRLDCQLPRCGDGTRDPGEVCDGEQLGAATCVTLGFTAGALACDASCLHDTADCEDATR